MKKIMLVATCVVVCMGAYAQVTNLKLSDKVTINEIYLGAMTDDMFRLDTFQVLGSVNFRGGISATCKLTPKISIQTAQMVQVGTDTIIGSYPLWIKVVPLSKLSIEFGYTSPVSREIKPPALSLSGQFETKVTPHLSGMTECAKVKYVLTKSLQFSVGVAARMGNPEYSTMLTYQKVAHDTLKGRVRLTGWYTQAINKYGLALDIDWGRVATTWVYKQDNILAGALTLKFGEDKDYQLYSDNGYSIKDHKLINSETGFLKVYTSQESKHLPKITYLVGGGINYKEKMINTFMLICL